MVKAQKISKPSLRTRRTPKGTLGVRWRVDGKQFERKFKTETEALQLMTEITQAGAKGVPFDPRTGLPEEKDAQSSTTTICELGARAIEERWDTWSGNTRSRNIDNMAIVLGRIAVDNSSIYESAEARRVMIRWLDPELPLSKKPSIEELREPVPGNGRTSLLPVRDLTTVYLSRVRDLYHQAGNRDKALKPASQEHRITSLLAIIEQGVQDGLLKEGAVSLPPKKRGARRNAQSGEHDWPSLDEGKAMLDLLPEANKLMCRLMLAIGARPGEVLGLQVKHVLLQESPPIIDIVQSSRSAKAEKYGDGFADIPKTGPREVPLLDARLVADIQHHIKQHKLTSNDYLFGRRHSGGGVPRFDFTKPYRPESLNQVWARSVGSYYPYVLRHIYCSYVLEKTDIGISELCTLTGNTPQIVEKYYRHTLGRGREKRVEIGSTIYEAMGSV